MTSSVPPPLALALSPHLDDAVFSCGGMLARLAADGWRVVVATVFTRSMPSPAGFALACQLDKGLDADIDYMALRRAEDAEACRLLGADTAWLPFPEAPHRGYHSAAALFADVREDDRAAEAIGPAVEKLLREHSPALILAPQAIGGHVDHVVLGRVLGTLLSDRPVLWWRDFPYTRRDAPRAPFAEAIGALPEIGVPVAVEPRLAACAAYRTQLGYQFGGRAGLESALRDAGPIERFRRQGTLPFPAARAMTLAGAPA
ncbi:PIG-L deacetylase family protein [Rhizosaccharibacter radicis]|uniref:PIG-L family deacetylase n=1 Tax=Rhizosaccharibacter radicis TaxID=2782605 RepID=A0ABT1VUY7_9PROT|nr:PIG-L family deacetylase [Acetobacteraceae bacterium KSS12]